MCYCSGPTCYCSTYVHMYMWNITKFWNKAVHKQFQIIQNTFIKSFHIFVDVFGRALFVQSCVPPFPNWTRFYILLYQICKPSVFYFDSSPLLGKPSLVVNFVSKPNVMPHQVHCRLLKNELINIGARTAFHI